MESLDVLLRLFPGQMKLPLLAVGKLIGLAEQTTKNQVSSGLFPIHVGYEGRKRVCHILDVAEFLEKDRAGGTQKKKRGRPSKAEVMARHASAAGGEK